MCTAQQQTKGPRHFALCVCVCVCVCAQSVPMSSCTAPQSVTHREGWRVLSTASCVHGRRALFTKWKTQLDSLNKVNFLHWRHETRSGCAVKEPIEGMPLLLSLLFTSLACRSDLTFPPHNEALVCVTWALRQWNRGTHMHTLSTLTHTCKHTQTPASSPCHPLKISPVQTHHITGQTAHPKQSLSHSPSRSPSPSSLYLSLPLFCLLSLSLSPNQNKATETNKEAFLCGSAMDPFCPFPRLDWYSLTTQPAIFTSTAPPLTHLYLRLG